MCSDGNISQDSRRATAILLSQTSAARLPIKDMEKQNSFLSQIFRGNNSITDIDESEKQKLFLSDRCSCSTTTS